MDDFFPISVLWRKGRFFYAVKDLLKVVKVVKNKEITLKQFEEAIIVAKANTQCLFVFYFTELYFYWNKNLYIAEELIGYFEQDFAENFDIWD